MKIPLSQVRFEKIRERSGLELARVLYRKNEQASGAYSKGCTRTGNLFGELTGLEQINQKNIWYNSYGVAKLRPIKLILQILFLHRVKLPNLMEELMQKSESPIIWLWILQSILTSDSEADPSKLIFLLMKLFSEKRPFFIEGIISQLRAWTWWWRYRNDNLFYSRRIGRSTGWY